MREWKRLLDSPGWKLLARYADAQVKGRKDRIVLDEDLTEKALHFMRGETAGVMLFLQMPQTEIDRIDAEVLARIKLLEETSNEPG